MGETIAVRAREFVTREGSAPAILVEMTEALEDWERSFDLYHAAIMRGTALWRAAHPGNDLVAPDTGKLVAWLLEITPQWRPIAEAEPLVIKDRYFPFRCLIQTASGYIHGGSAHWQNVGGRGSLHDPRLELRWYSDGRWLRDAKYFMPFPKPRAD